MSIQRSISCLQHSYRNGRCERSTTVSFSSGLVNNVLCDGDAVTFDASGTTGATSYQYFINGLSQGGTTVASFTAAAGTISNGM